MDFDGFDWDQANSAKCQKHGLTTEIIEDLFTRPVAILPDDAHSQAEPRFKGIGRTTSGRAVFLVFTLRRRNGLRIRPISARYMHAKETRHYEKENPQLQK